MPKQPSRRILPEFVAKPTFEQFHTGKFKYVPGKMEKFKDPRAEILKINKGIYYRYKLYETKKIEDIINEYRQDENKNNLIRDIREFIMTTKPNKDFN